MLKVVTFNAAILDVRIFGHSFYRAIDHIDQRLSQLALALEQSGADIVFLQELFHRDKQDVLSEQLRKCYPYVSGFVPSGWKLRLGSELLILSRFPLTDGELVRFRHAPAEELRHTSKGFYHVEVELPELGKINLINFHMSAGGKHKHPEFRTMETIRQKQIEQLVDYARNLNSAIMAGDLNAGPEASNGNYQQLLSAGWHDLFAMVGAQGFSWDPDNPLVKQGSESHLPPQRIDHVFVDKALCDCLKMVEVKLIFDDHCVTTSEGRIPLSDHYGLSAHVEWS